MLSKEEAIREFNQPDEPEFQIVNGRFIPDPGLRMLMSDETYTEPDSNTPEAAMARLAQMAEEVKSPKERHNFHLVATVKWLYLTTRHAIEASAFGPVMAGPAPTVDAILQEMEARAAGVAPPSHRARLN